MTVRFPQGNVLLRDLHRDYPVVSHGRGVWLFDTDGRRYLDASSGAYIAALGHGNTEIADAIHSQMSRVAYVNGLQFTSGPTEELATRLSRLSPAGLDRASFLCSGSEAVEAAIKLARQLATVRGDGERDKLVARVPGYHGNTLFALSASGRPHYKTVFGPLLSDVLTVSAPYAYRSPVDDFERDGADYYASELRDLLIAERGRVFAFIAEPVIGSSAGAALPPAGYFSAMAAVCREFGVLMIADEVLSGAGRVGTFFASEATGFSPDILVFGKGISAGYVPLSGLIVRRELVDELVAGGGSFMHSQTWMQAPVMTAAGVAVLDYFERHGTLQNVRRVGSHMQVELASRLSEQSVVGNVSGMGMLAGIELVADRRTREPFARRLRVAERFSARLFENGLVVWSNTGQANGVDGDLVMLAPPLIADREEVDHMIDVLVATLSDFTV